jgi:hypothetical protein
MLEMCFSYEQQIVGSCFLIQSANLRILMEEFSSLTCRVMIETCLGSTPPDSWNNTAGGIFKDRKIKVSGRTLANSLLIFLGYVTIFIPPMVISLVHQTIPY